MEIILRFMDIHPFISWLIAGMIGTIVLLTTLRIFLKCRMLWIKYILLTIVGGFVGYLMLALGLITFSIFLFSLLFRSKTVEFEECDFVCEYCPKDMKLHCKCKGKKL